MIERPKKLPDALFQEALNYLKEGGFRVTKPREVIVRAAVSFTEPFNAEDLLAKARELDRLISLGDDLSNTADDARQSPDS